MVMMAGLMVMMAELVVCKAAELGYIHVCYGGVPGVTVAPLVYKRGAGGNGGGVGNAGVIVVGLFMVARLV